MGIYLGVLEARKSTLQEILADPEPNLPMVVLMQALAFAHAVRPILGVPEPMVAVAFHR